MHRGWTHGAALVPLLAAGAAAWAGGRITDRPAETKRRGLVVAAPHEGYDLHTGPMAEALAERLGWGLVVADGYRSTSAGRWFDVNRPTQRPRLRGRWGEGRETDAAREVYREYQERLFAAGRVEGGPLELLVELHGHARHETLGGRRVAVEVIELATSGFTRAELRRLKRAYYRLAPKHVPEEGLVHLAVDRLDPTYQVEGEPVPFYFRASGAREAGSLHPERAERALHFELPPRVRAEAYRQGYVEVLAGLLDDVD